MKNTIYRKLLSDHNLIDFFFFRFVCQTSEDAIVIAATLYKSLVAHMKAKERKPRNRNGVTTCMSVASSVYNEKTGGSLVPVRPPRKKRSSTSSVISETDILNVSEIFFFSASIRNYFSLLLFIGLLFPLYPLLNPHLFFCHLLIIVPHHQSL